MSLEAISIIIGLAVCFYSYGGELIDSFRKGEYGMVMFLLAITPLMIYIISLLIWFLFEGGFLSALFSWGGGEYDGYEP